MKLKTITPATIFLLIVFLIDFFTPLGMAIGVLYLFSFLLVCSQNKKTIITFAIITSILTITKLLVFLNLETNYIVYVNRCITLGIIWIIAILTIRHRTLVEQINLEREAKIKELEEMLFITSHEVRRPIASCLGLMDIVESGKSLSQDELWKIIKHLKSSALELDGFTKKLTKFIYEMTQRPMKKI